MDYTITFEERPQYLYALVEGEHDSYAISKAFWLEIIEKLKSTGIAKVLVHEKLVETVSIDEVFQLVMEFPEIGLTAYKIAFVDEVLDHHALNQFGAILAINLNLNGGVFNTVEAAEEWLLA
jgi:hypothetical protein